MPRTSRGLKRGPRKSLPRDPVGCHSGCQVYRYLLVRMVRTVRVGDEMRSWQVQDAKARFSELMRDAAANGPQTITVRGRRTAVVLSAQDFDRLKRPSSTITEFLRASPLAGVELDVERDLSPPRDMDL